MKSMPNHDEVIFFDAGMFIGALLKDDPRHDEARSIVESARYGLIMACPSTSVLSEVYAALTWEKAKPPHSPAEASNAVRLLIEPPSEIRVIGDNLSVSIRMLELATQHNQRTRRIHDVRHAATALESSINKVYTYDVSDWQIFELSGIVIDGPPSVLSDRGH